MANRAVLRAQVKVNIGGRTDRDSTINLGLEEGLKKAMEIYPFKVKDVETDVAIVENSTYAALPTNTLDLVEARLIDGTNFSYPIQIKDKKWLTDRWADISVLTTSKPVYGYIDSDKLYLYPISDGSYTIRMTTRAKPTFNNSDVIDNPIPTLDFALICFATAIAFKSIHLFEMADPWMVDFGGALTTAIAAEKRSKKNVVKRMEDPWEEKPEVIPSYLDPFQRSST